MGPHKFRLRPKFAIASTGNKTISKYAIVSTSKSALYYCYFTSECKLYNLYIYSYREKKKKKKIHCFFFFKEFQPIKSILDDSLLSSNEDTNQFLM